MIMQKTDVLLNRRLILIDFLSRLCPKMIIEQFLLKLFVQNISDRKRKEK
jgi:hypothetical protein